MPSVHVDSAARSRVLDQLKDDHQRVKHAWREFQKLVAEDDVERCGTIVRQALHDLQVHTTLEEELLYPVARDLVEAGLVDEAEVEHEAAHVLMDRLRGMDSAEDKFVARFTVLCEYVLLHVREEEQELFPQLERSRGMDWKRLASAMDARRKALQHPAAPSRTTARPSGERKPVRA